MGKAKLSLKGGVHITLGKVNTIQYELRALKVPNLEHPKNSLKIASLQLLKTFPCKNNYFLHEKIQKSNYCGVLWVFQSRFNVPS